MYHPMNVAALISFTLLCSAGIVFAGPKNDLRSIYKITSNIKEREDTISNTEIINQLAEIKSSRTQVGNILALYVANRHEVMVGLCLYKLIMMISNERCLQSKGFMHKRNHHEDNQHTNNYIELYRVVHGYFESQNMRNFIDSYYNIQYALCRHNILGNFDAKHVTMIQDYEPTEMNRFVNMLVMSFPAQIRVNVMNLEQKLDGFKRFLLNFYELDCILYVNRTRLSGISSIIKRVIDNECNNYLLSPLHTLIMTYDLMGRGLGQLEYSYGRLIRAYDLCLMLKMSLSPQHIVQVGEKVLNDIELFGSSWKDMQLARLKPLQGLKQSEQSSQLPEYCQRPSLIKQPMEMFSSSTFSKRPRIESNQASMRTNQSDILITQTSFSGANEAHLRDQSGRVSAEEQNMQPYVSLDLELSSNKLANSPRVESSFDSIRVGHQEVPSSMNLNLEIGHEQRVQPAAGLHHNQQASPKRVPRKGLTFDLDNDKMK